MGSFAKKSLDLVGLNTDVDTPGETKAERDLRLKQEDKLNEQDQEIARRRFLLQGSGTGRRQLLSGGQKGVA